MSFSVLVVDDSPAMRTFIRRVMDLSGFDVGSYLEAGDGEEAIEMLKTSWVDIILTDINMPRMNGEELLGRLERHEVYRTIPVDVISTDSTESRIDRMLTLGAKGYVRKPFTPETLRGELERVMEAVNA